MNTDLLLLVIAIGVMIPLFAWISHAIGHFMIAEKSRINSNILDELFNRIWNGTAEDVQPAWYRVVQHIDTYFPEGEQKQQLLIEAQCHLLFARRDHISRTTEVNRNGKLIERTIINNQRPQL